MASIQPTYPKTRHDVLAALLIILLSCSYCVAYNILVMSYPTKSHISGLLAISQELGRRGHQVRIFATERLANHFQPRLRGSNVTFLDYFRMGADTPNDNLENELENLCQIFLEGEQSITTLWAEVLKMIPTSCIRILKILTPEVLKLLREEKFNVAVVLSNPTSLCSYLLPLVLDIPWITYIDYPTPWSIGVPWLPSFIPIQTSKYTDRMSFVERLDNSVKNARLYFASPKGVESHQDLAAVEKFKLNYSKKFDTLNQLISRSSLFLLSSDNILGYARPMMPNVIEVGGLTTTEPKPLPNDMKAFMDGAEKGVIVVTFGSNLSKYPKTIVEKFSSAFSRLSGYRVIWRLTNKDNVKLPTNVKIWSWLPQNDALGHNNTKLFITHCGNSGQFEALYNKVPMIGFPFLGDQPYNSVRMQHKGYGLAMNIFTFTSDELLSNMEAILSDPAYRERISNASEIFRSVPQRPTERAAHWVEHICRFGGEHLRSAGSELEFYQYLMLDVLTVVLGVTFMAIFLIFKLIKWLKNFVRAIMSEWHQKSD